jgi:hypothetical protein
MPTTNQGAYISATSFAEAGVCASFSLALPENGCYIFCMKL